MSHTVKADVPEAPPVVWRRHRYEFGVAHAYSPDRGSFRVWQRLCADDRAAGIDLFEAKREPRCPVCVTAQQEVA